MNTFCNMSLEINAKYSIFYNGVFLKGCWGKKRRIFMFSLLMISHIFLWSIEKSKLSFNPNSVYPILNWPLFIARYLFNFQYLIFYPDIYACLAVRTYMGVWCLCKESTSECQIAWNWGAQAVVSHLLWTELSPSLGTVRSTSSQLLSLISRTRCLIVYFQSQERKKYDRWRGKIWRLSSKCLVLVFF